MRILLLLIGLALVLPPATPTLAQTQGDQGTQGGWAIDDAGNTVFTHSVSDQLPLMRQAGAGWVRINFRLGGCYADWTTRGCNGRTALQAYDDVVGRARAQNLQILGLLSNESWPRGQDDWIANNAETAGGNGDNAYVQAFANSAAGPLARHFAGQIGRWELWNEPNAWTEIDGSGNPRGGTFLFPSNYAWMLRRAQSVIKAARPDAVVVSGGLLAHDQGGATFFVRPDAQSSAQSGGQPRREVRHGERVGERRSPRTAGVQYAASACQESRPSGAAYLCDLYVMGQGEAGWQRGASPLDAIGLHPYIDQGGVTSAAKLTAYLQEIRAAYTAYEGAGTARRIEVTEAGWTTDFVSATTQASNVRLLYDTLRGTSYVERGYWFAVQDIPEASLSYGLYNGDAHAKPALTAYQQATTGSPPAPPPPPAPNCTPRPRVSVQTARSGDGRLLVTVSASGANNWLTDLRFTQTANALVDLPGQSGQSGSFTVSLPSGSGSTQFWIRRASAGTATVRVTAVDRCGDWPTFVGGGPSGF